MSDDGKTDVHLLTVTQPSIYRGLDAHGSIVLEPVTDVHPPPWRPVSTDAECNSTFDDLLSSHKAPAGIVKTPGVDDVLERVELALEAQDFRNQFLEGEELKRDESESRYRELKALASAVNIRLADLGVRILGAQPETVGRGARFHGSDAAGREYTVDLHCADEDRMASKSFDAQLDGIDSVNLIERAVRSRFAEYQEDERMQRLGLSRGKFRGN